MEQSACCRQRKRDSSISSLHFEPLIDPENDFRDPIISSPETSEDECDEVTRTVFVCLNI